MHIVIMFVAGEQRFSNSCMVFGIV